jgi:hypothetical protein
MTCWICGEDRTAIASATTQPTSVQPRKKLITHTDTVFGTCRTEATTPGMKYAPGAMMRTITPENETPVDLTDAATTPCTARPVLTAIPSLLKYRDPDVDYKELV